MTLEEERVGHLDALVGAAFDEEAVTSSTLAGVYKRRLADVRLGEVLHFRYFRVRFRRAVFAAAIRHSSVVHRRMRRTIRTNDSTSDELDERPVVHCPLSSVVIEEVFVERVRRQRHTFPSILLEDASVVTVHEHGRQYAVLRVVVV